MEKTPAIPAHTFFQSFWMGGFECSDKLNNRGMRVNLLQETGHITLINEDYQRLLSLGISTVREGICWSVVEKAPYVYDWSTVRKMIIAGQQNGMQQIWDLCHFGFPDDLTPLHPTFAARFAAMCREFVLFYRSVDPDGMLIVTPVNEVNFLSWLGGEVRGTVPYCINMGWELKYALMKAYIAGVSEIKKADQRVLILSTEPLINIVPPVDATEDEIQYAYDANERQFQSLDMLTGRICPELGGCPDFLDIIGCNFYWSNQWEWKSEQMLPWANIPYDCRWQPLKDIFRKVFLRYQMPCILAETSHPGEHRPQWIQYVSEQCAFLLEEGFPLLGICIYPVIDRPDWDDLSFWHRSGIWDAISFENGLPARIPNNEYILALLEAQQAISKYLHKSVYMETAYSIPESDHTSR